MGRPIQKKALIQTERLTLKPFSLSDKDRLADLLTDQQITKTFMVTDFETAAQARALAEKLIHFSFLTSIFNNGYTRIRKRFVESI